MQLVIFFNQYVGYKWFTSDQNSTQTKNNSKQICINGANWDRPYPAVDHDRLHVDDDDVKIYEQWILFYVHQWEVKLENQI